MHHTTAVTATAAAAQALRADAAVPDAVPAAVTAAEHAAAHAYERASLSPATLRAYAQSWRDFVAWSAARGVPALPAEEESLGRYLAWLADRGMQASSIRRQVAAIARAHAQAGDASPTTSVRVRQVLSGIARVHGRPPKKKDALTLDLLRAAVDELGDGLRAQRDRALLLLGFATALRRSELVALDVADLTFVPTGLIVTARRSKTDQTARGREIGVPLLGDVDLCAVRAVGAWLAAADISEGPVFRSFGLPRGRCAVGIPTTARLRTNAVATIVQRAAAQAGIVGDFGGHSLRAGFITAAVAARVPEVEIARVSGHRSADVLRGYVRRASVLDAPPFATIAASVRRRG